MSRGVIGAFFSFFDAVANDDLRCSGGVDEATPHDVRVRTVSGGEQFVVIFSDEFDVDGRSFHKGTCTPVSYRAVSLTISRRRPNLGGSQPNSQR